METQTVVVSGKTCTTSDMISAGATAWVFNLIGGEPTLAVKIYHDGTLSKEKVKSPFSSYLTI